MFKWAEATVDEMARHIATTPAQPVTALLHYDKKTGNMKMLTAIQEARTMAKRYRAASKVAQLVEEYDLQGVEHEIESSQQGNAVGDGTQRG